jgi:hypothetical protein
MKKEIRILIVSLVIVGFNACQTENQKNLDSYDSFQNIEATMTNQDPFLRLNQDSVIKQYGERFFMLRKIINKHDPIGLIKIGAPEDEYDAEVATIIVQLYDKKTETEILELVYTEFLRWFNEESTTGPKAAYKELAQEIYEWKQKNN